MQDKVQVGQKGLVVGTDVHTQQVKLKDSTDPVSHGSMMLMVRVKLAFKVEME